MPGRRGRYRVGQGFAQRFALNRESPQAREVGAWWPPLGSRGTDRLREAIHGDPGVWVTDGSGPATWVNTATRGPVSLQPGDKDRYFGGTLALGSLSQFSMAVWVYATARLLIDYFLLIGANWFHAGGTFFNDSFGVFDGASLQSTNGTFDVAGVDQNVWRHLVVTYDSAGAPKGHCYKDGVDVGLQTDAVAGAGNFSAAYRIGSRDGGGGDEVSFTGMIGDLRLARVAWTPAEVWHQYAQPWDLYKTPSRMWARAPAAPVVGNPWYNYAQM